jgi:biofilm protein TabA
LTVSTGGRDFALAVDVIDFSHLQKGKALPHIEHIPMITDKLSNASKYYALGERIAEGLKFLERTDLSKIEPGRYEVRGNDIYVDVGDYQTKPVEEGAWEAHQKYIDIHTMARGTERMGYANVEGLTEKSFDEASDFVILEGEGEFLTLKPGTFMILDLQDGHMPGIAPAGRETVRKVVVKVRV